MFLTWHVKGSLPHHRYPPPGTLSAGKAFVRMDRFLDQMRGEPLWLRSATLHVHVLVTPRVPVPKLMRRLKGYTAREANRILNRTGEAFWQGESYDHWMRNSEEGGRIAACIERNPVTAGLAARPEDYRWSSAAMGGAGHRQDWRPAPRPADLRAPRRF